MLEIASADSIEDFTETFGITQILFARHFFAEYFEDRTEIYGNNEIFFARNFFCGSDRAFDRNIIRR